MNAHPFKPNASGTLPAQLSARRRQLQAEIRSALEDVKSSNAKEFAGPDHDLKDASLAHMLRDTRLFDMHRDIRELLDIDAAFERLQAGRYGLCVDCGERIPAARLRAYPTATHCHACQETHERLPDSVRHVTSSSPLRRR